MNNQIRILGFFYFILFGLLGYGQVSVNELIEFKYKTLHDIQAELEFYNESDIELDFINSSVPGDNSIYGEIKLEYTKENLTDLELTTFNVNVNFDFDAGTGIVNGTLSLEKSPSNNKYVDLIRFDLVDDATINLSIEDIILTHNTSNDFILNDYKLTLSIISTNDLELNTSPPNLHINSDPTRILRTNNLDISWNAIEGAERYELEYVFIDEEEFNINAQDKIDQAIRIYTDRPEYTVDLIYPEGEIYFRVRAVGYHLINGEAKGIKYGNWSSDFDDSFVIDHSYAFEEDHNWTLSKQFTEEGKSSVSVSFHDYSLRHRQTKVKLKEEELFLVNESKYDIEGRPSLQILPAPQVEGLIYDYSYVENFNPSFDEVYEDDIDPLPYNYVNIEKDVPDVMDERYRGASYYYSQENTAFQDDIHNDYLPKANGRPYTQTKFTNDNTGRVVAQSGVGEGYHIGSGHETKYFYATVEQEELERLFGDEIGDASHYTKTITLDPNGQASATYHNLAGQVIASCLIGEAPNNVLPLDDINKETNLDLGGDDFGDVNKMESVSQIYIDRDDKDFVFEFSLTDVIHQFTSGLFDLCGTCNYKLNITVTDECGLQVGTASVDPLFPNDILGTDCTNLGSTRQIVSIPMPDMPISFNSSGVYRIHKVLELIEPDLEDMIGLVKQEIHNQSANNNDEYLTFSEIFNEIYSDLIEDDCLPTCYTICHQMALDEGLVIDTEIQDFVAVCMLTVCNDNLEGINGFITNYNELSCLGSFEEMRYQIVEDEVFLNNGNYVDCILDNDLLLTGYDANGNNFNIGRQGASLGLIGDDGQYLGQPIVTLINEAGQILANFDFDNLSTLDKSYWQESWSDIFVPYHIEYCHYEKCHGMAYVNSFGATLARMTSLEEALAFFMPFNDPALNDYEDLVAHFVNVGATNNDPLFVDNDILDCTEIERNELLYNKINNFVSNRFENSIPNVNTFFEYIEYYENEMYDGLENQITPWGLFSGVYSGFRDEIISIPTDASSPGCHLASCVFQDPNDSKYASDDLSPIFEQSILHPDFDEEDFEQQMMISEQYGNYLADGQLDFVYSLLQPSIISGSETTVLTILTDYLLPIILNFCDQPCLSPGPYPAPENEYPVPDLSCCVSPLLDLYTAYNDGIECPEIDHASLTIPQLLPVEVNSPVGCEGETVAEEFLLEFNSNSLSNNRLVARFNTCPDLAKDIKIQIFQTDDLCDIPSWVEIDCTVKNLAFNTSIIEWSLNQSGSEIERSILTEDSPTTFIIRFYRSEDDIETPYVPTLPFTIDLYSGYLDYAVDHFQYAYNTNWPFTIEELYNALVPYLSGLTADEFEKIVLTNTWNCIQDCSEIDPCLTEILDHIVDADFATLFPVILGESDLLDPSEETDCIKQITLEESHINSSFSEYKFKLSLGADNPFLGTEEDVYIYFINEDGTFIYFDEDTDVIDYAVTHLTFKMLDPYLSEGLYIDSGISILYSSKENDELKYHKGYMLIKYKNNIQQPMAISCDDIWNVDEYTIDCEHEINILANELAEEAYNKQILDIANELMESVDCRQGLQELFTGTYNANEYHHTLYYYDRAGNLIKTVPPEGIDDNFDGTLSHEKVTTYNYNSYNQITFQNTPDAGDSYFLYDDIQRLRASRNDKQLLELDDRRISYTKYDDVSRIVEVGEKKWNITALPSSNQLNNPLWPSSTNTTEITKTFYDSPPAPPAGTTNIEQDNIRGRISVTQRLAQPNTIEAECRYSYDAHGNVKHLKTIIPHVPEVDIYYDYELVSGNVNQVSYNPDKVDQFYHKYEYDLNNRLEKAFTSSDKILWEEDARYIYYNHGPLARMEMGHDKIQGCDYAYTLQGWIKSVNSPAKYGENHEPGKDGKDLLFGGLPNPNSLVGRDGAAFRLGYNSTDYSPISNSFVGPMTSAWAQVNVLGNGLYNGNIAMMSTNIAGLDASAHEGYLMKAYNYDQLHRVKESRSYGVDNVLNEVVALPSGLDAYKTEYDYDADGNLQSLKRFDGSANLIDDLVYNYNNINRPNQLTSVKDENIADNAFDYDVDNQLDGNYEYDAIGNLISNDQDNIENIVWDVYGKVTKIVFENSRETRFTYDASGNRVSKEIFFNNNFIKATHYLRDATGNIMSTYERLPDSETTFELIQKETPLYGSSRLGQKFHDRTVYGGGPILDNVSELVFSSRVLNYKSYELSNHLGNVLASVSDEKIGVGSSELVDYYTVDYNSISDYYPFGMEIDDRNYVNPDKRYRYGFNGKERDESGEWGDLTHYDYGFRIYNPGIAKFLSVDPLTKSYPWYTPYQFAGNKPIAAIDLDGLEEFYSADGMYLGKYGESTELRIIGNSKLSYLANERLSTKGISKDYVKDILIPSSVKAYRMEEEQTVFKEWATNYMPKSTEGEYAMALFKNTLTKSDGESFEVFVPGTTAKPNRFDKYSVDPYDSKLDLGGKKVDIRNSYGYRSKSGWERYSTIHTHPRGASSKLSFEYGTLGGISGDIPYALKEDVMILMVQPGNPYVTKFNPEDFKTVLNEFLEKYPYIKEMSDGTKMKETQKLVKKESLRTYGN